MKIIVKKVSQKTFDTFKSYVINNAPDDYYNRTGSVSSKTWRQSEARSNDNEQAFIDYGKKVLNLTFPFNLYVKANNYTHGVMPNSDKLVAGNDWAITTCWGFICDDKNEVYAYSTCGGNVFGVYVENGQYYAFGDGRRCVITIELECYLSDDELNSQPVLLETTAPKDMKITETLSGYLIRKGEKHAINYFADLFSKGKGIDDLYLNEQDAFFYFDSQNIAFKYSVLLKTIELKGNL